MKKILWIEKSLIAPLNTLPNKHFYNIQYRQTNPLLPSQNIKHVCEPNIMVEQALTSADLQ